MSSNQVIPMNGLPNSDEVGITVELTDAQIDAIASEVGRVVNAIPFVVGDLYNQKCRVLGIDPNGGRPKNNSGIGSRVSDPLDALCDRMGVERGTAEKYAVLARKWPRADRCAGLTMRHYQVVSGMEKPQAVALLKAAQIGDQKEDGSWVRPWSTRRLQDERAAKEGKILPASAKTKGQLQAAAAENTARVAEFVMPQVEKVLDSVKLPPAKAKAVFGKIEKAVAAEVTHLRSMFDEQVRKKVADALPEEVKQASKRAADTIEDFNERQAHLRELSEAVAKPITLEEFKLLRSFCHEDKFQHDPVLLKKAQALSVIINRLGSKLGYIK